MRAWELMEEKWWDETPMIRLYHGTSSALADLIRTEGLKPPVKQLDEYALDILAQYIPREEWDENLVNEVHRRAARMEGGRASESGRVIFCMTDMEGPAGYARSYAEHGGEIARDVWDIAVMAQLKKTHPGIEEITYREYQTMPKPIKPRFQAASGVVVEMLVPKEWCLFYIDLERTKRNIAQARDEGLEWAQGDLGAVYDDIFDNREVRVSRDVPPSMIVAFHEVGGYDRDRDIYEQAEDADIELYHGTSEPAELLRKHGLRPGRLGCVFLTDNPDLAISYAETDQDRTGNDTITVVSVRASALDLSRMEADLDHSTAETWLDSLAECDQCMYLDAIPPELLTFEQIA